MIGKFIISLEDHMHTQYALLDKKLVFVDDVKNGIDCDCVCSYCGEALIAKNGGKKRIHHFSHKSGTECAHGYETSLHLLAKKIIEQDHKLQVPEATLKYPDTNFSLKLLDDKEMEFSSVSLESKHGSVIPDITCFLDNRPVLFVEIKVTHGVDEEKLSKLREHSVPTLEIDLSDIDRVITEDELRLIIRSISEYKKWIYHNIIEEYTRKLQSVVQTKMPTSRGFAFHYDECPIRAREYKGKSYANVIDDCLGCEHFIEWAELGIRCAGRFGRLDKSKIDALYEEYLENPSKFVLETIVLPNNDNVGNSSLNEKVEDSGSDALELLSLAELWNRSGNKPFRAMNVESGLIVDISVDPRLQWLKYNGKCYGVRQQDNRFYGNGVIYYSERKVWLLKS
jgi:hypothetical protein